MTILATHFAIVLGAWRLRVRIDLDEPRDAELRAEHGSEPDAAAQTMSPRAAAPGATMRGNDGWAAMPWSGARFVPPRDGPYDG
ncbi:MAG TPA: hypothetical protein VFB22_17840 [Candidatus Baltobacteraceae bacterium]|nr:hypothetical protein [Candidatus Baltobacteraceae bacterium]